MSNKKGNSKAPWQRGAFNTVVILLSIFIPTIAFLLLPLKGNQSRLVSKLANGNLTNTIIIEFLIFLFVGYALLFITIVIAQKKTKGTEKLKYFLVDKNYYKFINGLYGFILAVFLFFYTSISKTENDSILFFKFMVLSFAASNFFFTFCELNLKQYNTKNDKLK